MTEAANEKPTRGRAAVKWLRRLAKGLAWTVGATVALILAAYLALTTLGKGEVIAFTNSLLEQSLRGRLVVERADAVGLFGVEGVDARLESADGELLARLEDASVRANGAAIAWDFLFGSGALEIGLEDLQVEKLDLLLEPGAEGELTFLRALQSPEQEPSAPGREVRLSVEGAHIAEGRVHGRLADEKPLDVQLRNARFDVELADEQFGVDVDESGWTIVDLPGAVPTPIEAHLAGGLQLAMRAEQAESMSDGLQALEQVELDLRATVADARLELTASKNGPEVQMHAALRNWGPKAWEAWGVPSTASAPTTANVDVAGTLPDLDVQVVLETPSGRVASRGLLTVAQEWSFEGSVDIEELDLNQWVAEPEVEPVSAEFSVDLKAGERGPAAGRVEGELAEFEVAGVRVPPLGVEAKVSGATGDASLKMSGQEGLLRLEARAPEALNGGHRVEFSGAASAATLEAAIPASVELGPGRLKFSGTYDWESNEASARVQGQVKRVAVGGEGQAHDVSVDVELQGSLQSPQIEAKARAERADILGRSLAGVTVQASGTTQQVDYQVDVEGPQAFGLSGTWSAAQGTATRGVDLRLGSKTGPSARIRASRLAIDGPRVEFRDLRLDGLGTARLDGWISPWSVRLVGTVRDVSTQEVASLLDVDLGGIKGTIDLDADYEMTTRRASGRVRVRISRFSLPLTDQERSRDWDVAWDLIGDEGRVRSVLRPVAESSSGHDRFRLLTDFDLGPVQRFDRFQGWLDGLLEVNAHGGLDLGAVSARLPDDILWDARGQAAFVLRVQRDTVDEEPALFASLSTQQLQVARLSPEGERSVLLPSRVDIRARARYVPDLGLTRVATTLKLGDRPLVWARARVDGSLADWRRAGPFTHLEQAPLEVRVRLPRRSARSYPAAFGLPPFLGDLAVRARLRGSLAKPMLDGHADLHGFRSRKDAPPVDGTIDVTYRGDQLDLDAKLTSGGPGGHLDVKGEGRLSRDALFAGELPKSVNLAAQAERFPLSMLNPILGAEIAGELEGQLEARGWGTPSPSLDADLALDQFEALGIELGRAELEAHLSDGRVDLDARSSGQDWKLRASSRARVGFADGWTPEWEGARDLRLEAQGFPLELLRPLVSGQISGLGGELHADLRLNDQSELRGTAKLREVQLQVPELGQRLSELRADLVWTEGSRLRLENGAVQGATGRATFEGSATLDGLLPKHLRFELDVDRSEPMPLNVQGVGLGEFWGHITAQAAVHSDEREVHAHVGLETLQVHFPRLPTAQVQSLDAAPFVTAGAYRDDEFVELPLQPIESDKSGGDGWGIFVDLDLGDEVWIHQGPTRRIQLLGSVQIEVQEELRTSGEIRLRRGQFELNGRMFEVDEGTITFQPEEPGNPIVVASATWDSPQGIVVEARFVGPVQNGELTLTSSPSLPKGQILSLLLFGSTSGIQGSTDGGGSGAARGLAVGGGLVSQGLNQALSRVDEVQVTTRVQGDSSGNVRPEVVVQLTNSLSAQVSYKLLEPRPGTNSDRTLLTLELRLVGGHSVSSTLGDRGSAAFDWHWRYRY